MKFRTDINGLRAYAVLAVIIFHFNKSWLSGGFAGVDVFFVISGYLMTAIIFREIENKHFSIISFYCARIRRIIPALLVLISILVIFGYLLLAPIPYNNLAKDSASSLFFVSNIVYWAELYWRDSGYFDASVIEKFLLHTWSLSVEWQFYMIYPVILSALAKIFSIQTLKKLIVIATFLSFIFAIYTSSQWAVATYFLLPSRIWEMLVGGIAYLYPLLLPTTKQKQTITYLGLLLVVSTFFMASELTPWPGYATLIPTLGTFIFIQANNNQSLLTNNIICQKLGLWSYSLYLYHWPLMVINHKFNLNMNIWMFLLITLAFSIPSYYWVETKKWKVWYLLVAILLILLALAGVSKTNGVAFRVDPKFNLSSQEQQAEYYGGNDYLTFEISYINQNSKSDNDFIVIGDSFSRQYARYLDKHRFQTVNFFTNGCLLLPNVVNYKGHQRYLECQQFSDQIMINDYIRNGRTPIIWAQHWTSYRLINKNQQLNNLTTYAQIEEFKTILLDEIKSIRKILGQHNLYIIGETIPPPYNTYSCLAEESLLGNQFLNRTCGQWQRRKVIEINTFFSSLQKDFDNIYFINPNDALCDDTNCQLIINGNPVFSDLIHLSIYGAEIVATYIINQIEKIEQQKR